MKPELAPRHPFEEIWKQRFAKFAAEDGDAAIAGWSASGLAARLRNFERVWQPIALGERWLDAGCGAGTYSRFLAGRGLTVVGLDYSVPTIMKARTRGGVAIQWSVGDATQLPVKPGSFAGVICFGVTQALARSDRLIDELTLTVRPGGEIWVDALNAWCVPHWIERTGRHLQKRPEHVRYETPGQLECTMRERGIIDVKRYWVPILPRRFRHWQCLVETSSARLLFSALPPLAALLSHAFVLRGRRPYA
jgi:2-polyprenyl-3-methyl-5-hydroxy-6-metoxy-1,4-benzoquinol methylase